MNEVLILEDYIIIRLLNDFKGIIEKLQSIEIDNPLDYLKEVVNELMADDEKQFTFDDSEQMYLFLKRINKIKNFFKNEKDKKLKSIISYLFSITIPTVAELVDLAETKNNIDDQFNLIDLNEVILNDNDFQDVLNVFNGFRVEYSNFYILKHIEINSLRGNFGENLIITSEFKLLSELSSVEKIRVVLLNPPSSIRTDIQTVRNLKCPIRGDELEERLINKPDCANCHRKFEDLYGHTVIDFLAIEHQRIKQDIEESLLTTLQTINDKEERINEILERDEYRDDENLINFFRTIFNFFNNTGDDREITSILANNLFDIFSEKVIEVIIKALQEEPVTVIIDIVEDIVEEIEQGLHKEEDLITIFNTKRELAKEIKKQEKFDELGLGPDDDKPVVRYRFSKR